MDTTKIVLIIFILLSLGASIYSISENNKLKSNVATELSNTNKKISVNINSIDTLQKNVEDSNSNINQMNQDLTNHQTNFKKEVIQEINEKCSIWSVSQPSSTRMVTGDEICKERGAGICILTVNYDRLSARDMIQRCTPFVTGRSDMTAAYCCST